MPLQPPSGPQPVKIVHDAARRHLSAFERICEGWTVPRTSTKPCKGQVGRDWMAVKLRQGTPPFCGRSACGGLHQTSWVIVMLQLGKTTGKNVQHEPGASKRRRRMLGVKQPQVGDFLCAACSRAQEDTKRKARGKRERQLLRGKGGTKARRPMRLSCAC